MKKLFICILMMIVLASIFIWSTYAEEDILSDNVTIQWSKIISSGEGWFEPRCIQELSGGGYMIAGSTSSDGGNVDKLKKDNIVVAKLSAEGKLEWEKLYGGSDYDNVEIIKETSDEGYVFIGTTSSNDGDVSGNHGSTDIWLVKISSKGNIQWQKCFGGSNPEAMGDEEDNYGGLILTDDGGYIILASTQSNDGDVSDNDEGNSNWMAKVSNNGKLEWTKCINGRERISITDIKTVNDGGYIICGEKYSPSSGEDRYDACVLKLSKQGDIEWQKTYGGSNSDGASNIYPTEDGGYLFSGYTDSNDRDVSGNHGARDIWIVKLFQKGNIEWQKCLGTQETEFTSFMDKTEDDGYILSCGFGEGENWWNVSEGNTDISILKISSKGNLQWSKNFGGNGHELYSYVKQVKDGGYIVSCETRSDSLPGYPDHQGWSEAWVLKLKDDNDYSNSAVDEVLGESTEDVPSAVIYNNEFVLTNVVNESINKNELYDEIYIEIDGVNITNETKIKFGNILSSDVKAISDTKLKAKLPKEIEPGVYDVIGINNEGQTSVLDNAFTIYESLTLTSIKVGNLDIEANIITKIDDEKFLARGNVKINNFLRTPGELEIHAYSLVKDSEYRTGDIKGDNKLYVSLNGNNDSFIHRVLSYKEINISKGNFFIDASSSNKSFFKKTGLCNIDLGVFKLEAGTICVLKNEINLTIGKFAFGNLLGDFEKNNSVKGKFFPIIDEVKMKITVNDVLCKANFGIDFIGDSIKLPLLKSATPSNLTLEIDTISENKNFMLKGDCGISLFNKVKKNNSSFSIFYKAYSKDLRYPDEIGVKLGLGNNSIPLHPSKLVYLKGFGGGASQLYEMVKNNNLRGIKINAACDIGIGLNALKLPLVGDVDIIGLEDLKGSAKLDFKNLSIEGKLKLLGFNLADGSMEYDCCNGFTAKANGEIELALILVEFGTKGDMLFSVTNDGLLAENNSEVYINKLWTSEKYSGDGNSKFIFNKDVTVFVLTARGNNDAMSIRVALDNEGNILNLFKKVKVEIDF
ncbi:MAG: hypothetical protein N4A68_06890 [Maledivibacter sp.]|jgi:hypothetical protein|nr:hypothetical protein [Maledivibacter sp.]